MGYFSEDLLSGKKFMYPGTSREALRYGTRERLSQRTEVLSRIIEELKNRRLELVLVDLILGYGWVGKLKF